MFRFITAGESHGQCLTAIIEGLPSGLYLIEEEINKELARRQQGYGRGGRMKIEKDRVKILSGVRGGYTLGSPVTLQIENRDWENWKKYMSPGPDADLATKMVTNPRPGHADLAGALKYGHQDMRNILERSSARETAARVAVGAVAKTLLKSLEIHITGQVLSIAEVAFGEELSWEEIDRLAPHSEVFCASVEVSEKMKRRIDQAKKTGDTLGGIFEVVVKGLPVGLGSHVHWDRRLDGKLAQTLMSIPAIKGVEIGWGFRAAREPGSMVHDEIFYDGKRFLRRTNHAGGLEGGITNGELLVTRAAMKPIPTLMKPLWSVDFITKEPVQASVERSDVCAVPAALVVGEAAVAITLADALLEKYGGDHLSEINYRINKEHQ